MQIVCLASSRRTLQLSEWRNSSPCLVQFQVSKAVIYKTWVFILSVHLHFFLTWLRSMGDEDWEVIPSNLFQNIYISVFGLSTAGHTAYNLVPTRYEEEESEPLLSLSRLSALWKLVALSFQWLLWSLVPLSSLLTHIFLLASRIFTVNIQNR